ncbi:MAG: beta-1,6-N-acetylglucosaminyltransferase [Pseudomonadota bacterium]
MSVGFAMLAHERLDRAAAVARHLALSGSPVVVHLDTRSAAADRAAFQRSAGDGVTAISTRAADWGRIGLVEASLDCLKEFSRDGLPDHVTLISGSCLPTRPVEELAAHLSAHPDADFIESTPVAQDRWVVDGLSSERFTLHHWFSWRRSRWMFDRSVALQRQLGVRRTMPTGLTPHLGGQWWCLSSATISALLAHPDLPAWLRFFKTVWIPDEAFFQTVIHQVASKAEIRPPIHLVRWGTDGRPFTFHDDHLDLLAQSDAFFARKIDPDADQLYQHFLGLLPPETEESGPRQPAPRRPVCEAPFEEARARDLREGRGQLTQSRYPGGTKQSSVQTAGPYLVLVGDDVDLLQRARTALAGIADLRCHGDLFGAADAAFASGETLAWGNLPGSALIRDYQPSQFLANLVRADRRAGASAAFLFTPSTDAAEVARKTDPLRVVGGQLVGDGNARLILLGRGDDLLDRLRRPLPTRRKVSRPQKPREIWAWQRAIDADDLAIDLGGSGAGQTLQTLRQLAAGLTDQAHWTTPEPSEAAE